MVSVAIREPEPLVRRVRSRTVAKVDSMGLVVRTADKTTLRDFVKKIEDQYGKADRVWLMDRGHSYRRAPC